MEQFVVRQSGPLAGSVSVGGAKNAVLKHLVATLLAPGRHTLTNVPGILDVEIMCQVLGHVGAECSSEWPTVTIDVPETLVPEAPIDLVRKMRASILVLGALLARCGEARVALPGGDDFGSRPIDMHIDGLEAMGARFDLEHGVLRGRAPDGLTGAEIHLEFPSVGATENLLLAGVMANGTTVIGNAAREPELEDLATLLSKMGAKIEGAGTSTIRIHGVPALEPATHAVVPDRLEAGTYLLAGATTGGTVTVTDCVPDHLRMELTKMRQAGCEFDITADSITVHGPERATAVDFSTLPYPGFHTDLHPQMVSFLTKAEGTSFITENIYAARFRYVGELNRMGADVHTEGQHVVVRGVESLSGCPVEACDIRAGAAIVLAGLVADGYTIVNDVSHIDRGYYGFVPKMQSLGALIERRTPDSDNSASSVE